MLSLHIIVLNNKNVLCLPLITLHKNLHPFGGHLILKDFHANLQGLNNIWYSLGHLPVLNTLMRPTRPSSWWTLGSTVRRVKETTSQADWQVTSPALPILLHKSRWTQTGQRLRISEDPWVYVCLLYNILTGSRAGTPSLVPSSPPSNHGQVHTAHKHNKGARCSGFVGMKVIADKWMKPPPPPLTDTMRVQGVQVGMALLPTSHHSQTNGASDISLLCRQRRSNFLSTFYTEINCISCHIQFILIKTVC